MKYFLVNVFDPGRFNYIMETDDGEDIVKITMLRDGLVGKYSDPFLNGFTNVMTRRAVGRHKDDILLPNDSKHKHMEVTKEQAEFYKAIYKR